MAEDTLDKLTKLLTLMKGASSGITPYQGGGGNVSVTGVLGGLGEAAQHNKSFQLQHDIQKWQFEQEKERAKRIKDLEEMQLSQERTKHQSFLAQSQEAMQERNRERVKQVLQGKLDPNAVQWEGDKYLPGFDESGKKVPKPYRSWEILEQVRRGGLESVDKKMSFEKQVPEDAFNIGKLSAGGALAGPMGVSGFVFQKYNPFSKKMQTGTATLRPNPADPRTPLIEGMDLDYLQNLQDLSISSPEVFSQPAKDAIRMEIHKRKQFEVAMMEEEKAINAKAIASGIITEEEAAADAQFGRYVNEFLPTNQLTAKMEMKRAWINRDMRGVFQGMGKFINASMMNKFGATTDYRDIQKLELSESKNQTPLPGLKAPEKPVLTNKSVSERRKYGVNKNASKTSK